MAKTSVFDAFCTTARSSFAQLCNNARMEIWIGGAIILGASFVSLLEGWRLISERDPNVLYDPLGPGWYIVAVAGCAALAGITYMVANLTGRPPKVAEREPVSLRLIGTVGLSIMYALSIYAFGYFISTILYLVLQYRLMGVETWVKSAIYGVVTSIVLWLVFVYYSDIIFPAGVLSVAL